ncbi:nucleotidyltransferase domain-containing protein [Roseomonas stagni]|uniref:Nucleotidyltransferase domain-containing protein n=1 Tax=Falsiroseomonas algicola TaxID=2716930 RepID=A0A6M1LRL5_9PROT|nr:nucleotidyltransferase domain-containing protein [Falsiroseomonas algicola]NGM22669.1 nucleotidyltransferase domain-containing protein [Falsiroseomonas algicola]
MPTIQDIDRAEAAHLAAARAPLIAALTAAAQGRPWHYILFGSLARGTARRGSDADIAIVGAGRDWAAAESAAHEACRALKVRGDVMLWEDLAEVVRAAAEVEGVRCG